SIRNRTAFRRRDIAPSRLQWIARLPRYLTCGCQQGDSNHLLASGCELSRRLAGWDEIFPRRHVETEPAVEQHQSVLHIGGQPLQRGQHRSESPFQERNGVSNQLHILQEYG